MKLQIYLAKLGCIRGEKVHGVITIVITNNPEKTWSQDTNDLKHTHPIIPFKHVQFLGYLKNHPPTYCYKVRERKKNDTMKT